MLVVAPCLTAAALLAACGGEPQPGSPASPTVTTGSAGTNTPDPTEVPPSAAPGLPATQEPSTKVRSDRERASPSAGNADLAGLVDGNNAFAFDLYRALRAQDGNLFYSPHSISLALAMTHAGARGETEQQMADALRFSLPRDRLHPAFNALDQELASRGEGLQEEDGEGFRLSIVNAVWGQREHPFWEPFLDVLAESYGAGVRQADFREMTEESRLAINDWVAENTEDKDKGPYPAGHHKWDLYLCVPKEIQCEHLDKLPEVFGMEFNEARMAGHIVALEGVVALLTPSLGSDHVRRAQAQTIYMGMQQRAEIGILWENEATPEQVEDFLSGLRSGLDTMMRL